MEDAPERCRVPLIESGLLSYRARRKEDATRIVDDREKARPSGIVEVAHRLVALEIPEEFLRGCGLSPWEILFEGFPGVVNGVIFYES